MPKQVTVFDWYDEVQPKLIENLGIKPSEFRCYVGDEWRDYWHVFLSTFGDGVHNDTYQDLCEYDDTEYVEEHVRKDYGDWAVPFVKAMHRTIRELAGKPDPDSEEDLANIVVWFSW